MSTPTLNGAEIRTRRTFSALMWALNYPGRSYILPESGLQLFSAIAETLVDLETSWYSPSASLQKVLVSTGGRTRPPDGAHYQFYPELGDAMLPVLGEAPVGSYAYPDEATTLVIGCTLGIGQALRLNGPGVPAVNNIWVKGIPRAFWALRERACQYPLGWDVFLVSRNEVVGLPRTTYIEVT